MIQEQLKLWKDFEWEYPDYDIFKPYERYDKKLLLLTKNSLNHGIINAQTPNYPESAQDRNTLEHTIRTADNLNR